MYVHIAEHKRPFSTAIHSGSRHSGSGRDESSGQALLLQSGSASVEPDIVVTNVITTTVTIFAGRDKPFIIGHFS